LLAIDESTATCDKRFAKLGFPQTVAARQAYMELIITTAGVGEDISGVICIGHTATGRRCEASMRRRWSDLERAAAAFPDPTRRNRMVDHGPTYRSDGHSIDDSWRRGGGRVGALPANGNFHGCLDQSSATGETNL
jgi:hypothetical protein